MLGPEDQIIQVIEKKPKIKSRIRKAKKELNSISKNDNVSQEKMDTLKEEILPNEKSIIDTEEKIENNLEEDDKIQEFKEEIMIYFKNYSNRANHPPNIIIRE